jgi:plastocyanin
MFKNQAPWIVFGALLTGSTAVLAAEKAEDIVEHNMLMDHGDGHLMDMEGGMIMGQNKDKLPPGCGKISGDEEITVRAGRKYSKDFPGTMFGFSQHEWKVKPCTRLTVHFINEDHVRHQWMMHGLPKFLYDKGMFHLEVTGPAKVSGTLILPAEDRTYLVHCDIAQHMEKGMKGQLIVGNGSGTFPTIPGVTDPAIADDYGPTVPEAVPPAPPVQPQPGTPPAGTPPASAGSQGSSGLMLLGILLGAFGTPFAIASYREHFRGKSAQEVLAYSTNLARHLLDRLLGTLNSLFRK